jgi:iron complex transport system substrate-binding protein
MKRMIMAMALVVLSMCAVPGCLEEDAKGPSIFMDGTGAALRLNETPLKVISLTPALTEIVFLLGCGDRLVGIDSDSNYPPEASGIEKVSSWQSMNLERIVALGPDLVLMDRTLDSSGERYDALSGVGIPVYRTFPKDLDGLLEDIEGISKVLGVQAKGEDVVSELNGRIDAVAGSAALDVGPRPSVLHIVYYDGGSDPWIMTSSTFSGDLVRTAGGRNAIDDDAGISVQVNLERLIASDPDIIICSQSGLWPTRTRELVLSDPALKDVSAVRSGLVRDLDGDLIDRTGPRLVDGLEQVRGLIVECDAGG